MIKKLKKLFENKLHLYQQYQAMKQLNVFVKNDELISTGIAKETAKQYWLAEYMKYKNALEKNVIARAVLDEGGK